MICMIQMRVILSNFLSFPFLLILHVIQCPWLFILFKINNILWTVFSKLPVGKGVFKKWSSCAEGLLGCYSCLWWCMVTEGSQITNKMENMLINLVHHEMDIIIHKQIMIVQLNAEVEDRRVRDSSRMENWSQNKLVSISTHKTANIGNKMRRMQKERKL